MSDLICILLYVIIKYYYDSFLSKLWRLKYLVLIIVLYCDILYCIIFECVIKVEVIVNCVVEFCNEWPKALTTDERCDELFPIEVITRDIVSDGSSVRDPRARVVTLRVNTNNNNKKISHFYCVAYRE